MNERKKSKLCLLRQLLKLSHVSQLGQVENPIKLGIIVSKGDDFREYDKKKE